MAQMNQEMYGATGKVGNKVYYRANGKTVVREAVDPKNPKTDAQTIQRVIAAQVGKSYNKFRDICDHSFEGYDNSFDCMNKFKRVNLKYLHEHAATLLESGQGLDHFYQFTPLRSEKWTPFAAIISEGHLPVVTVGIIISREDTRGNWLRSNCQLVLNEEGFGSDLCSLAMAVEDSYKKSIDIESDLYLNNAGGVE